MQSIFFSTYSVFDFFEVAYLRIPVIVITDLFSASFRQSRTKHCSSLKAEELNDLAFTAIVNNRIEFVKFFLERRLRLSDLLMNHNINKFYTEVKMIRFPFIQFIDHKINTKLTFLKG